MYLYEIAKDSNIQISVGIGFQTLEFDTKILEIGEQCIYAEPIIREDKMVGFSTKGLVLRVFAVNQDDLRVYQFNNVKIRNIKMPDEKMYHEITCALPGKIVNRRAACRVWLGFDGIAQIGLNKRTYDVIIKDISVTGISFICGGDVKVEPDMVVHLTFEDESSKVRFSIGAIVVRSEEADSRKIVYGCRLNQESSAISKYVNEKQREKLRATRTVNAIPPSRKK